MIAKIERIRKQLKSKPLIKWIIKKRLFSVIPLFFIATQLHLERIEVRQRGERITELTATNEFLREHVNGQHRIYDGINIAMWEKALSHGDFIMLDVNEVYVDMFLKALGLTERDYIGTTDFDVHAPEAARRYRKIDSLVAFTGKTVFDIEPFIDSTGTHHPLLVIKWRSVSGTNIYVRGAALQLDRIQDLIKEYEAEKARNK